MIGLQLRAVHQESGLGLYTAVLQRRLRPPLLGQAQLNVPGSPEQA
jgi:hypothetical protein